MVSEKRVWVVVFFLGLIMFALVSPASSFNHSSEKILFRQNDDQGRLLDVDISGPGLPPENWNLYKDTISDSYQATEKIIDGVPALLWSYGCTPTSASMLFGYYDRHGFPDIYNGSTQGGVFPLTSVWGPQTIQPSSSNGECPLSASHQGVDGRSTKGHVDDYYYAADSEIDPYYGNWTEHSADSLADFMGTNQYQNWQNTDGTTTLYYRVDNTPNNDPNPIGERDGAHGMKLFAEYRGYSVDTVYNQRPAGFNNISTGFTYTQYKSEIDNNTPVLIHVTGHSMLGVGYRDPDQIIFHNTWDPDNHNMSWGGSYDGRSLRGVTVLHLRSASPTVTSITPMSGQNTSSVSITNLSGTTFINGATVHLARSGYTNISATGVIVVSSTKITCTLPITGKETGKYNVVVTNPDGKQGILSNGFTITGNLTNIGIFRASTGYWYFDYNLDGIVDHSLRYGGSTDQIIAGDWQGTGIDGIAIFRPSTGYWYFDNNIDGVTDRNFRFGGSTDRIIAGNWTNTSTGIAIFRPASGYWYFDYNLDGIVDKSFRYGGATDQIIKGDWQGTGTDGIAIFRPSTGYWYFDYNLDGSVDKSFRYGGSTDQIIVGKWQGTPQDGIAIFRPASGYWYFDYNLDGIVNHSLRYGGSTDQIIAGDWQGTGIDGIAIFRPSSGYWYFDNNLDGIVDKSFRYGGSTDQIIVGKWV